MRCCQGILECFDLHYGQILDETSSLDVHLGSSFIVEKMEWVS